MCEASVYILADGQEKLLLDSVDIVEPREDGKLYIRNLVGEQKIITARI
ncbi:MAG: CooT family nickel-binding protein, partial [Nitrospirae bacterium]|nr:CooT family nickel-binding protein [Nitrospirota bacterium]